MSDDIMIRLRRAYDETGNSLLSDAMDEIAKGRRACDTKAMATIVANEALIEKIDTLKLALRNAARNDKTRYNHHEPRPFDGQKPSPGTIWLTPREIARSVLQEPALGTGDDL